MATTIRQRVPAAPDTFDAARAFSSIAMPDRLPFVRRRRRDCGDGSRANSTSETSDRMDAAGRLTALNAVPGGLYCGPMDDRRLQLVELLDFRPDEGVIRLHEQRVVILSAAAMGLLRKELIDTLGAETARRLLMRFGFADGYHDAVSLRDRADWSNPLDGLRTGAVVHTLEGIVRSDLTSVEFDRGDRPLRGRGRMARFV